MNKQNETSALIDRLGDTLQPVRRLPSVRLRTAALIGAAALAICTALLVTGGRRDLAEMLKETSFILENLLMTAAAIAAAIAAFHLAIPDTHIRPLTRVLLVLSTGIWFSLVGHAVYGIMNQAAIAPDYQNIACVKDLALLASLPLLIAFVMLARSAPVWRGWAGYAAVLGVSSASALGMRLLCGNDDHQHLLLWHFIPVIGITLLGLILARNLPVLKKF